MIAKIQKWGNSQGIRISKVLLDELMLSVCDEVSLTIENDSIIIKPVSQHKSLAVRVAEYQGEYNTEEWTTGQPTGDEVW